MLSGRFASGLALGCASVAVVGALLLQRRVASEDPIDLSTIVSAAGHRPIVPRLDGLPEFKPLRNQRSANVTSTQGSTIHDAILRLERQATEKPSVESLRELGAGYLLLGERRIALATFERALRFETREERLSLAIRMSKDASLLADYSAASYEAAAEDRVNALIVSLAAAGRAARLDPVSATALWNRAVALQGLGAQDEARDAWDAYLRVDSNSAWASEARQRRASTIHERDSEIWPAAAAELRTVAASGDVAGTLAIVRRFPLRTVILVEKQILPAWGRAFMNGNAEAAETEWRIASRIAGAITEVTGDPLLSELTHSSSRRLAEVFADYGDLGAAYQRGGSTAVIAELTELRDRLKRLRSPAELRLTISLATGRYQARDHTAALAELRAIEGGALLRRYPIARAQGLWACGLALASIGHANQAIDSYREAIEIFRAIGDLGAVGALELMIADAAEHAGDFDRAWTSYLLAMPHVDLHGEPMIRDQLYFVIARSALRRGYPDAALILQDGMIERLRDSGRMDVLVQALTARCETHARLGKVAEARADCSEARGRFNAVTDHATRDRLVADLGLATALAEATATSDEAPLTAALEVSRRGNDHFRIPRIYLERARVYLADGNDPAAESDLRQAIDEIEGQREKLESDDFRVTLIDSWRMVHEELLRLLLRHGRFEEALAVADSSRARILLDRYASTRPRVTIEEIRRRLPPGASFVELWTSSDDEVVIWVVRAGAMICRRFSVPGLVRRTDEYLGHLENGTRPSAARREPEILFDELIRPWFADLSDTRLVILSADGSLSQVPFASLVDRATGRPLLKTHTIVVEPSAAMFVASAMPATAPQSVLMVDNPSVASERSELPTLSTRGERDLLDSGRFGRFRLLAGRDATPSRFLQEAAAADIVHFAGHATDDFLGDGALIMAPEGIDPSGMLTGGEIASAPSRRGSLVVLAACRTSRGRISSEGALSLARAFLVTGSSAVIGSLWNIDDEAAGKLFVAFYEALGEGHTVPEALRKAQIELSRTYPDPQYWAGFQVYGGV